MSISNIVCIFKGNSIPKADFKVPTKIPQEICNPTVATTIARITIPLSQDPSPLSLWQQHLIIKYIITNTVIAIGIYEKINAVFSKV